MMNKFSFFLSFFQKNFALCVGLYGYFDLIDWATNRPSHGATLLSIELVPYLKKKKKKKRYCVSLYKIIYYVMSRARIVTSFFIIVARGRSGRTH